MIVTRGKTPTFPKDHRPNKGDIVRCRVCNNEFKIKKSQQLIFCSNYCRLKFITIKYKENEIENGTIKN